jgi:hypothetical protein
MSTMDNDTEPFAQSEEDEAGGDGGADSLFGCYSVLAPGVQIVIDGRPVSAPAAD